MTKSYILSSDLARITPGSEPTEAQPYVWEGELPSCPGGSFDLAVDLATNKLRRKTEAEKLLILAEDYKNRLYEFAEVKRGVNITPGFGQAQAYVRKQLETLAYLADSNPTAAKYPVIASEVGITGANMKEVALNIKARIDELSTIELCLNRTRLLASKRLSEAITRQELDTIFNEAMLALDSCIPE